MWQNARKSSASAGTGQCVVIAEDLDAVGVSDSQDDSGTVIAVSSAAWREFVDRYIMSQPLTLFP